MSLVLNHGDIDALSLPPFESAFKVREHTTFLRQALESAFRAETALLFCDDRLQEIRIEIINLLARAYPDQDMAVLARYGFTAPPTHDVYVEVHSDDTLAFLDRSFRIMEITLPIRFTLPLKKSLIRIGFPQDEAELSAPPPPPMPPLPALPPRLLPWFHDVLRARLGYARAKSKVSDGLGSFLRITSQGQKPTWADVVVAFPTLARGLAAMRTLRPDVAQEAA